MATITTPDNTTIFFKDWGSGQPVVFSHGWPLNSDAWDSQLLHVASNGFRAVAADRRGHGRSGRPPTGNDMDTYADDLAAVIETLDLHDVVLVGHSTGGGEVVRYVSRHGTDRVRKIVLVGAVPPQMLRTSTNPGGMPVEAFDAIRAQVLQSASQTWRDLAVPFFGANRPGSNVPQGVLDAFWLQGMQADLKAAYECIAQWSETDFSADLLAVDVPALIVHGDDDQIVPIDDSARLTARAIADAELKVYPGAPHGLYATHPEQFNADLLEFVKA